MAIARTGAGASEQPDGSATMAGVRGRVRANGQLSTDGRGLAALIDREKSLIKVCAGYSHWVDALGYWVCSRLLGNEAAKGMPEGTAERAADGALNALGFVWDAYFKAEKWTERCLCALCVS